ncbi:unnamed protein product [Oreochromis niloticus]|nr:unnamed protein product [Mustela putorius furo]
MFCPECGTQVDRTFKFCPECGYKLFLLSQKKAQDGATSTHIISATTKEKTQKEDQDQAPKEDEGIKENTTQIQATSTNSNKDTGAHLAKEQQRGKRDVVVSRPPTSPSPPHHSDVQVGHQRPQNSSVTEGISVYFHVIVSKDFHWHPEKDVVVLKSKALLGSWDGSLAMFPRSLGDKRYLVERHVKIPKEKLHESIPYKYAVYKHSKGGLIYEAIYQEEKNEFINRCLSVKQGLLTREGEWHQYDDMIHPKLNTAWYWNTAEKTVMEGRDQAGWEMLKIIFDLLTTWNEQNVENFFLLLQQFIHTYTCPLLHDGMEKRWGLPYGSEQIKNLLKKFLEEIIGLRARKKGETVQSLLPNLHAGIIGLLVCNKYLKDSMRDKLSILCSLLCLPEVAQDKFAIFWENFANPLTDKKSVADALENLCHTAITHHIEKWVLIIPLIHLLRAESKPFEPVTPVLNPQYESWRGLRGIKGPSYAQNRIEIMKEHAYLAAIDHLLVHSWMSLIRVDDLMSFMSSVRVELLDILHYLQFSIKSGITHPMYKVLINLTSHVIKRESHQNNSFDDKNGECCLKTAVMLLGSVCNFTKGPNYSDLPLHFLELVCLIAKVYGHNDSQTREQIQEESFGETLETMRKWRRNTFTNKLLNEWNPLQFSVPNEMKVYNKIFQSCYNNYKRLYDSLKSGELLLEEIDSIFEVYKGKCEDLKMDLEIMCRITLENSLTLQIEDGHANMTYTYEDLKELQNKLMLMSGKKQQNQSEVERFTEELGRKENFAFLDVFPKVFCRPPKEVLALEMQKEQNPNMDCDDPLMDDECFRSEAYQRPYQYLTRFHNNDSLDNFTYRGIEGTHAKCLQILLINCGIIDPSWAELRNFVWFLNLQLKDCENSDFCKVELVGDTLCGFKNFVVEFMILMSKDFATPSLCITDQSPGRQHVDISGLKEKDLAPFLIRKRWESEPHPYIFFNDDHMSMTFIGFHLRPNGQEGFDAVNPLTEEVIKKNIMTRQLYNGLKLQRVPFNADFDQLPRADKIEHLCSVLGIKWPTDPDVTYELTTDNILKMMAIHMRFRCGIPVIIMGETGCGKTRLIKFMCELRRCGAPAENMKLVKVHGGTTSEMIYEKVKEAETVARTNKENHDLDSVLFFDEANTTEAISSIKEVLCDNSVRGQELGSNTGLQIIAACNPYRKHTDQMIERLEASGLGYRVRAEETEDRLGSIPLRQLVYRVHVLPPSMIPLVWDFGQLNDTTEQMYIEQIVQRQVKASVIDKNYIPTIIKVLSSSQKFMRARKDECSFVSLRDVERCMQVFLWFHKNHPMFAEALKAFLQQQSQRKQNEPPASNRVIWSLLMATGVCYQSCLESKNKYLKTVSQILPDEYKPQRIMQEIQLMQDLLLNGVPMGKTIARNEALKENFFMMVVCIELRIPLFIVGKPGSSKSLSKTLVADAMQGPTSHSDLYKKLKQIHLVSFQCSPHSTPEGIINTFKQCARFQESKNLDEYISVVLLDEIGLAEDSPKMPLKALHPLLEEGCVDDEPKPHKRVGFIGISNWALDPAKMNRGIFVSRGDLNKQELIKSASGICSSDQHVLEKINRLFEPFAKAYMTVCKKGKGFFGLRDFYSLIKMLFSITKTSNKRPTADQITGAVLRNFSGKDDVNVIDIFSREVGTDFSNTNITTIDMVEQSICPASKREESRYLLVLTKNFAALQILQQIFCSHQIHPEIIFGSSFPKDQEYTQICRNINRVKVCMETGQTVVLLNLQNLYESLYDALNQYYVTLGGQNYVDLGLGTHRVKCRVHENFKLIVIEEKEVVYEQFPIPLINRLEKHYLDINTVLTEEQKVIARQLEEWVNDFVSLSSYSSEKKYDPSDVFIGYHSDTCSSMVMQVTERESTETNAQVTLNKAKDILLNCATLDSVIRLEKSKLPDEEREHLMQEFVKEAMHSSLGDYIVYHTQQPEQSRFLFTEDSIWEKMPQEGNKAAELQCFINETQFLQSFLAEATSAPATVSIQHLQHIARLRVTLIMASQLISDRLSGNNVPDGAEDFLNMVIKLCEDSGNNWYRVYLIRKLSESQGVEYVQTMVKQPEFFWLFPEEIHQQCQKNEDGGLMDQYLVYGEEYKAVRDAVAKALVDGNIEQIEEVCECGRPMERGRCLECGEEIGGEHHIALPGFTQVPLHEDQTRPGHILGDPERRNNPDALDTKSMSLTPFTLVRLVTHLAMMLGASEKPQVVQQIIQPPVEDVSLFLRLHIIKDLEQLSQALGKGADDTVTSVHLVLKSLQELPHASNSTIDPYLTSKESRNTWETTVATDIMTPKLKDLDQLLQEANGTIRNDSRVSSNFIIRTIHGDDCSFLASLQQCSEVDSSAVWSCRERLSLLSLTHIMETNDQKEELPLLWRFLQKEREFRHIKFLPEILMLQKHLVRKYQNATEEIVGSIRDFIDQQIEMSPWYQKHIETFLKTWNELRVSVTGNEIKIPEEFCSRDLDLDSDLQYLLPRRQGPGLCATGLVSYLVTLHNELVNAVDRHTREDSSDYTVSLLELTEQHVISYDVEKDLFPLVLSNCQYSLERGHETMSEYDLPRIQQQILTRFLQGKPLITRAGIPTLVNTQERDYETIFKTVHGKVPQSVLTSMAQNTVSRQLDSYSEVCEVLKIVELLLGFLSMTGGDPTMKLVTYLQEILKMDQNIDHHILKAFSKCELQHCVCLWQVLSSLRSEKMLQLKREPFSGYPAEYQVPLTEENKTELKGFMSRGNVDQWLLEMHEFLLLRLGRLRATEDYNPSWSLKEAVGAYMDRKEVEVAPYVEENFSENVQLSQIIETWKYTITAKQELMME